MRPRRLVAVGLTTGALLLATVLPASAHPFFTDGATVPVGSLATVTLAMAHGCGTETDAGGDPTTEIAVEVPESVSFLEPGEVEGYEVEVEGDPGAVPDVVIWTATDGGEPAPELPMDLVIDGQPGDEVYVRVFQGCEGFEYRWVGTPEDPADDPAVLLTLGEPDPDAPPPPEPEPTETTPPEGEDPDEAIGDEVPEDADDPAAADDGDPTSTDVDELPTDPPEDEDGGVGPWVFILGAIVLAGIGALAGSLLASRRRQAGGAATDPAGTDPDVADRADGSTPP